MCGHSQFLSILADCLNQAVGTDRSVGSGHVVLIEEVRVRACALSDDNVVEVDAFLQCTTGTDSDELRAAKDVDELPGVQRD